MYHRIHASANIAEDGASDDAVIAHAHGQMLRQMFGHGMYICGNDAPVLSLYRWPLNGLRFSR